MTIVASWGGVGSNAYAEYSVVDSIITTTMIEYAAWTDATTTQREAAIISATRDIDTLNYAGKKYYQEQRLAFPRGLPLMGNYARTYVTSSSWTTTQLQMKTDVEYATAEQALWLLRIGGRNDDAERINRGITQYSETVGPISESVRYGSGGAASGAVSKLSPEARSYLSHWIVGRKIARG